MICKVKPQNPRITAVINATERVFADESFGTRKGRELIMGEMPDYQNYLKNKEEIKKQARRVVSTEMLPCWKEPLLSAEQEKFLFMKFNLLKLKARDCAFKTQIKKSEQFLQEALAVRETIALANMRLSVNAIKKIYYSNDREDLVAMAYADIFKSTEYFDWRKGFKFSTYATRVVTQNLWRTCSKKKETLIEQDCESFDNLEGDDLGTMQDLQHRLNSELAQKILEAVPEEREKEILKMRFGIGGDSFTLQQCGDYFGVTKERIRQIQSKALDHLRLFVKQKSILMEEIF